MEQSSQHSDGAPLYVHSPLRLYRLLLCSDAIISDDFRHSQTTARWLGTTLLLGVRYSRNVRAYVFDITLISDVNSSLEAHGSKPDEGGKQVVTDNTSELDSGNIGFESRLRVYLP
jgi:hypothetical protein